MELILLGIIYILMMIISYKPFKRFADNNWSNTPIGQIFLFPFVWVTYAVIAIIKGFKYMWNNKL